MALPSVQKHVNEIRAWPIKWGADIGTATISTSDFTIESIAGDAAPLTLNSQSNDGRTVTALFEGGTAGKTYQVENKVALTDGQTLVYEFEIEVYDN